jgi:hypothetical protein
MTHRPTARRFTGTPPTRAVRLGDPPYPSLLFSPTVAATSKLCLNGWCVLATDLIVCQVSRARLPRRSLATARAASLAGRAGAPAG